MDTFTDLRDQLRIIGFDIPDNTYEKSFDLSIFKNEIDLNKFKEVVESFIKKK